MEIIATYRHRPKRRVVLVHIPENGARCWATFYQVLSNGKPMEVFRGRYFNTKHEAFDNYCERCKIDDATIR